LATSRILRPYPFLSHPHWPLCRGLLTG
jgi:hypothetical protein